MDVYARKYGRIFDLDGVVVNSEVLWKKWKKVTADAVIEGFDPLSAENFFGLVQTSNKQMYGKKLQYRFQQIAYDSGQHEDDHNQQANALESGPPPRDRQR